MDIVLAPLLDVLLIAINLYEWVVILAVVINWLIAFNVLNTYNRMVGAIHDVLFRLTEPALKPIRRVIPTLGGVDLSPIVLIFILFFIESVMKRLLIAL